MTSTLPDLAPDLSAVLQKHAERLDVDLIDRALRFSASAHRGQKRMSGEDFVSHSIAVAHILAEQLLDTATIAAALLHDVVEDSDVRQEDIDREFGPEIAGIVDGLTKISSLTFRSSAEEQVENYRKLLLSIAKDARVIIIKLGDRLHNMRTLEHLSPERRQRIATETREIYAPLAHRFGMAGIKAELEDLAFKFLEPEEYRDLVTQVAAKRAAREQTILKLRAPLEAELKRAGIEWFEVTGRPKHLWSIFQKMRKRNKGFDEIYDLMAIRVIVRTVPECYHVLGVTRRGFGASSAPSSGYGADRLGDDVLAVTEALSISKPVLVGHSLGGEELSSIGSRYPDKVAGLIYLDAAYSYAFYAPGLDPIPEPQQQQLPPLMAAIIDGMQRYTEIPPPILAIYALPHAGLPDASLDVKGEAIAKAFEAALPHARVVRIPQANHFVFMSHEADVLREMASFLGTLK